MGNARKYKLNVSEVISCGVGTNYGEIIEHSTLCSFSVTHNTIPQTSCVYPSISIYDLMSLSNFDYEKRVVDYIDSLKIDNEITKERLLNESIFDEPECIECGLNPNFLVYKFLSGVRVVNIGIPTGIAQYRLYPSTGNSINYSWQYSPTFLNLNQNKVYIVEVRDYKNNLAICMVSTIISMPLLIPSTTLPPQLKTIRLKQSNNYNSNRVAYKVGCIDIIPPLQINELVRLDYIANALVNGVGTAYVQFTCKPNGSTSFTNQNCITNNTSSSCNSILIRYGDSICYSVNVAVEDYGSSADANYCISSADGLGTSYPTIDITNCDAYVSKQIQSKSTIVRFTDKTQVSTSNSLTINGLISFCRESIPNNHCVMIQLSGVNTTTIGTSSTMFSCKPSGSTTYIPYCTINAICSQPQYPQLIARSGDQLCYNMILDVTSEGSISSASICFNSVCGSLGVDPSIDSALSYNTVIGTICVPKIPTIIAVCKNLDNPLNTNGFINLSPSLSSASQYFTANIDISQNLIGTGATGNNVITFYCKPNNGTAYIEKNKFITCEGETNANVASITICSGDAICYTNSIVSSSISSESSFVVSSVSSSLDIDPIICSVKNGDSISNP